MVHPAPFDLLDIPILALANWEIAYHGKEAHASAMPEMGINAADAISVAQLSIGLLRQHIRSSDRVHGIVTKGGDAPNVVPAHTTANYYLRARTDAELDELAQKVRGCFEAGAVATGSQLTLTEASPRYSHMEHDARLGELYRQNAEDIGRVLIDRTLLPPSAAASTDMGNLSLAMPSIHPLIGINSFPASAHQPEFTAYCDQPDADKALLDGAKAMAGTVIDVATSESDRERLLGRTFVAPTDQPT